MPFARSAGGRIEIQGYLTESEVTILAADETLQVVQFSAPVNESTLCLLNNDLFRERTDVTLRLYGFENEECDLSILESASNIRRLSLDHLDAAANLNSLGALTQLRALDVEVEKLTSFEFLRSLTTDLQELGLGRTKSTRPDLNPVRDFANLRIFSTTGHGRGLSALSACKQIEEIRLLNVSKASVAFLSDLPKLWWLEISLGSVQDISVLPKVRSLKHLELCWIRGLTNLQLVGSCTSLQRLIISKLPTLERLPNLSQLVDLRALSISNMKQLESVDEIATAPALEWFGAGTLGKLRAADFQVALKAPKLKRATIYFSSRKEEAEFEKFAENAGVSTLVEGTPFEFI